MLAQLELCALIVVAAWDCDLSVISATLFPIVLKPSLTYAHCLVVGAKMPQPVELLIAALSVFTNL